MLRAVFLASFVGFALSWGHPAPMVLFVLLALVTHVLLTEKDLSR